MITIFTCPKAFRRHINVIQRNAIQSWMQLEPKPEIIIMGNEEGTESLCKEFGLVHVPDIKCNKLGIPLINSIFEKAEQRAINDILCYVNSDIILMSDFINILKLVILEKKCKDFLLIGKRWDIHIQELIAFNNNWEVNLCANIQKQGELHDATGKDYFVFLKHFFKKIPSFAIGRVAWDDWMVYMALKKRAFVIDITNSTTVVHQNHDFSHISDEEESNRSGMLAQRNKILAGNSFTSVNGRSIDDANYILLGNKILKRPLHYLLYRKLFWFTSKYYMIAKNFCKKYLIVKMN